MLGAIAGHDPNDSTIVAETVPDYLAALTGDISGMRIGDRRESSSRSRHGAGVEAAVRGGHRPVRGARRRHRGREPALPDRGLPTYYIIAPGEASANLARFDGVQATGSSVTPRTSCGTPTSRPAAQGFGPEVKRRIMLGTYALCGWLLRRLLRQGPEGPHPDQAAITTRSSRQSTSSSRPTSPTVAFKIGAKVG